MKVKIQPLIPPGLSGSCKGVRSRVRHQLRRTRTWCSVKRNSSVARSRFGSHANRAARRTGERCVAGGWKTKQSYATRDGVCDTRPCR